MRDDRRKVFRKRAGFTIVVSGRQYVSHDPSLHHEGIVEIVGHVPGARPLSLLTRAWNSTSNSIVDPAIKFALLEGKVRSGS